MKNRYPMVLVLFLFHTFVPVRAETVNSNLDATPTGWIQFANDRWLALGFTTDTRSSLFNSVTFSLTVFSPNSRPMSVGIYASNAGIPGNLLTGAQLQGDIPVSSGLYTYSAVNSVELMPNTSYFLVAGFDPFGFGGISQAYWNFGSHPATGAWEISTTMLWKHPTFGWLVATTTAAESTMFAIEATVVPEPAAGLLCCIAAVLARLQLRRNAGAIRPLKAS